MLITAHSNASQVAKQFGELANKQMPFAMARSLTWTAQESQKEIQRELPYEFTLRNNWTKQNIRITPAKKNLLLAAVGATDRVDYMGRQQTGGPKAPSGKYIAIPVDAKRSKKDIIRKANRPRAILNKKNYFKIDDTTPPDERHNLPFGIYKRATNGNLGFSLMYRLIPIAQIKPRFHIEKTTNKVVKTRFERLFTLSMDMAIKSAK
jgi:hypothetical protein